MIATKTEHYNLLDLTSMDLAVIMDGLKYQIEHTSNIEAKASLDELIEQIRQVLR